MSARGLMHGLRDVADRGRSKLTAWMEHLPPAANWAVADRSVSLGRAITRRLTDLPDWILSTKQTDMDAQKIQALKDEIWSLSDERLIRRASGMQLTRLDKLKFGKLLDQYYDGEDRHNVRTSLRLFCFTREVKY